MKHVSFCEYCMVENRYNINIIDKTFVFGDEKINYKAKEAVCSKCDNEIYVSEVYEDNLKALHDAYRGEHNIVNSKEIRYIMDKYSINDESLSMLLGWEKNTISRYLDGDMIVESKSDLLKKIYSNANYYALILQSNKERIDPKDFNKSKKALKEVLESSEIEEKVDCVIKYLLLRCGDITSLTLQKLLYYSLGFYYVFTDKFLFEEDFLSWKNGPVLKSVYERYERLGYDEVNEDILSDERLVLEDIERNIVESVVKFFGCYSSRILEQMTENEAPWILTRKQLLHHKEEKDGFGIIKKDFISTYFLGIKEKYEMSNILDIQRYSSDIFGKISM